MIFTKTELYCWNSIWYVSCLLDIFLSIQVLLNTCDVICQNPFGHVSDLERNRYYNLSLLFTTHWIVKIFSFYTTRQASYINLEFGLPRKTYVAFQLLLENRKICDGSENVSHSTDHHDKDLYQYLKATTYSCWQIKEFGKQEVDMYQILKSRDV
jgi:hypothetical protein